MTSKNPKDRLTWLQGPSARCTNVPDGDHPPYRVLLLGVPGVGKGTQAGLLSRRLGACHLSTGDIFREAASRPESEQSPAMKEALACMHRGALAPDSIVWEMVRERIVCLQCSGGFILDGFPRTLVQAKSLRGLMSTQGLSLTAVVNYELPIAEIVARLGGRRTCEKCKAVYHVTERPPQVADHCDACDGKLFQRKDDRPESIKVRMETYEESTAPLIDFYHKAGLLMPVAATGTPDEICQRTVAQLEPQRISRYAQNLWAAAENRR